MYSKYVQTSFADQLRIEVIQNVKTIQTSSQTEELTESTTKSGYTSETGSAKSEGVIERKSQSSQTTASSRKTAQTSSKSTLADDRICKSQEVKESEGKSSTNVKYDKDEGKLYERTPPGSKVLQEIYESGTETTSDVTDTDTVKAIDVATSTSKESLPQIICNKCLYTQAGKENVDKFRCELCKDQLNNCDTKGRKY